jgi:radical SAM protein with 4Fe4S-binding SPASM domain
MSLSRRYVKPITDRPSEIVLEITSRCNLACEYCTSAVKNNQHMAFAGAKKIMDEAKRCGIPAIRFTGGEPLLNPDLPRMLRYAKSLGFYVLLNTNATLITPAYLRILARSVSNILVSLQGFNSASEEDLTHSISMFPEKIKNIILLKSRVPLVRIGTVITQTLIDHWPRYVSLIKKLRPAVWEIFRPMNAGTSGEIRLCRDDYRRLATKVLSLKKSAVNAKLANALPFCLLPDLDLAASCMLGAHSDDGHSRLVRDVRGFFKPSYFINKNLGGSINAAWQHPFLKKLKKASYLPERCRTCAYVPWCQGGSRAMAKKMTGSYWAPDPLLRKNDHRSERAHRASTVRPIGSS